MSSCRSATSPTVCAPFLATARRSVCGCVRRRSRAPLGTGGALKFAEDMLDDRFLMLNGDVLTDIDISVAARGARAHGRERRSRCTPSRIRAPMDSFGSTAKTRFASSSRSPSPDQIDTNNISAGVYVLEKCSPRPAREGRAGLDRARRVPATRRRRALRPCLPRLLEGHRDAGAVSRGDVRHPRGLGRHRGQQRLGTACLYVDGRGAQRRARSCRWRWSKRA